MRKTIKSVMIVVEVLMTSCQVSLKPKSGPVAAHSRTEPSARANARGCPLNAAVRHATRENSCDALRVLPSAVSPHELSAGRAAWLGVATRLRAMVPRSALLTLNSAEYDGFPTLQWREGTFCAQPTLLGQ